MWIRLWHQSLQAGLILRLRAGFGVVASGSPTYVSLWNDLSGQGNNASGTSGSQPTFVNSGTNFLPAVKFNGSSQFLSFPSLSPSSFTGLSMFVVLQPSAVTSSARIIDFGDAASGNDVLFQISSSGSLGQFSTYSGTSGTNAQSASALSANQAGIVGRRSVWQFRDVLPERIAGYHQCINEQPSNWGH